MQITYFDNAASTRVDPQVVDAMLPFFTDCYANPSALHSPAQAAKAAVEEARESIAELLGANDPSEIIFNCGATEGNNQVIRTFDGPILISAIEHSSVKNTAENTGRCTEVPVESTGTLDYEAYERLLHSQKPQLVSVLLVNNEIGSIQDIDRIGEAAKRVGAHFHSDITQAIGKCRLDLANRPIDYATLSGHKMHAPKGVGVLWVRTGAPLAKFMVGGSHEGLRRAGTLNVPGIVGLGMAAQITMQTAQESLHRMKVFRQRIISEIEANIPDVRTNGQPDGAPHILSLSFHRTEGESVIINLDSQGICCTAGAACSSGKGSASHVLLAIGLPEEWLRGTVRISMSRFTTEDEVDRLIRALIAAVEDVRSRARFAVG